MTGTVQQYDDDIYCIYSPFSYRVKCCFVYSIDINQAKSQLAWLNESSIFLHFFYALTAQKSLRPKINDNSTI